jgi:hypothetical protein
MANRHGRTDGPRDADEADAELRRAALEPALPLAADAELDEVDPDLAEVINDTQTLVPEGLDGRVAGEDPLERARNTVLAGGDVDAGRDQIDSGEEAVGGSTPTPDQDVVDELGRAAGITYSDTEPLRPEDKERKRDDDRWELDPASSEDYEQRQRAYRAPKE